MSLWRGSRRELLTMMGLWPLVATVGGCNGAKNGASQGSVTDLRFWGTGTLDIGPRNWALAETEARVRVTFEDNGNDLGPVMARMVSGTAAHEFDIGGVQGGAEPELFRAGAVLPWNMDQLPAWTELWDWMRAIPSLSVDGQQIGIPVVANADSMIYRQGATGTVDSYAAVFDKQFKGRTSMEDSWMNSVMFTAIFMKDSNTDGLSRIQDPGNLEEDELRTVVDFLKKHKRDGQFYKFWNGWQEGVDLISTGRVVVMTGWEPIAYRVRDRGVNDVKYAIPNEGFEGWTNNVVLHKGVRDPDKVARGVEDAAYRFVNWQLSGTYGCILGALRGYMVPTPRCVARLQSGPMSYFDTNNNQAASIRIEQAQSLTAHVKEKFERQKGQIFWQNSRPKNYALYEQLWAELRAV